MQIVLPLVRRSRKVAIDIRPERSTPSLQVVVPIKSVLKGARLQPCRKLICTAAAVGHGSSLNRGKANHQNARVGHGREGHEFHSCHQRHQ
jgi:hypothetical protein